MVYDYLYAMPHVLAIDQGTQSTRAAVLDLEGRIKHSVAIPIALHRPQINRAEQDAEQIVQSVQMAMDRLFSELPRTVTSSIDYCGIATQRSTVLSWGADGTAISPALNWQDTRGREQIASLRRYASEIKQISGLPLSQHYGASKLHWLRHNCKGERDQRYGLLASFLLSRIGNKQSTMVDHGNAQRMQLLDVATGEWSRQLLELFDIPDTSLPECCPIWHNFGELREYGIPITAMNGDQNAAWFGSGSPVVGAALVNIGSGAFVLTAQQAETTIPELLSTIAYSDQSNRSKLLEATINGAGNALQWLSSNHGVNYDSAQLQQSLELISEPPIFLNTVGGLGSPWWNSELPPVFINNKKQYSTAEMLAGVSESILFLIYRNIQEIQKTQTLYELQISGGLSAVNQLCQKLANLSNLPVKRLHDPEATSKGIAWIACGRPNSWRRPNYDHYPAKKDSALRLRYELFLEQLGTYLEATKNV